MIHHKKLTMKNTFIALLAWGIGVSLYAQTIVPGGDVSGTWTSAGSPYHVTGDITIQDGATLIIEPGVVVSFQGHYHLAVHGRILALGNETDSILFTAANPDTGFNSIHFTDIAPGNDSSIFIYCRIEHGNRVDQTFPYNGAGGIGVLNFHKLRLEHCYFFNNRAMTWSTSGDPGGGAVGLLTSNVLIRDCTFDSNVSWWGGALTFFQQCNAIVENCLFINNVATVSGGAFSIIDGSSPLISGNVFIENEASNYGGAINITPIFSATESSDPVIEYNLFTKNLAYADGGAIEIIEPSAPVLRNNTIFGNTAYGHGGGIDMFNTVTPIITNTIIWNNMANYGPQVYFWNAAVASFYYSDIEGDTSAFGGEPFTGVYLNNINADPLFCDTVTGDFHLWGTTPCRESGDSACLAVYGKRCDMGYFQAVVPEDYCIEWPVGLQNEARSHGTVSVSVHPNPVEAMATFKVDLGVSGYASIEIFNSTGQKVAQICEGHFDQGIHYFTWNPAQLSSGMYLYRLSSVDCRITGKLFRR
jgi:hypothetical protein